VERPAGESQLLRFPAGKHDDAVDVLGLFGRGMPARRFGGGQSWMGT
jgi:hypothetical protein